MQSPSVMREAGGVLRAVVHIVFWSTMLMATTWLPGRQPATASRTPMIAVDEVAFRELASDDQRVFRQALEGLTEAEDARSKTGDWPTIEQLATRKIPPFVADPIDKANYRWTMLRDGTLINYLGVPDAASKRSTFVISVLEPDPGTPIDPAAYVDETHHKLKDGTLLHVSIWLGSRTLARPAATPPFEDGWRRITMTTP